METYFDRMILHILTQFTGLGKEEDTNQSVVAQKDNNKPDMLSNSMQILRVISWKFSEEKPFLMNYEYMSSITDHWGDKKTWWKYILIW